MKAHLPTLLWAALIGIGLLTPEPELARVVDSRDWLSAVAHVVLFGGLAVLLCRSLAAERGGLRRRELAAAFGITVVYGLLLEIGQIGVEGRGFEWPDLALNGIGALAGVAAARLGRVGTGRPGGV